MRTEIDLNECEHFLKVNWDRSKRVWTLFQSEPGLRSEIDRGANSPINHLLRVVYHQYFPLFQFSPRINIPHPPSAPPLLLSLRSTRTHQNLTIPHEFPITQITSPQHTYNVQIIPSPYTYVLLSSPLSLRYEKFEIIVIHIPAVRASVKCLHDHISVIKLGPGRVGRIIIHMLYFARR